MVNEGILAAALAKNKQTYATTSSTSSSSSTSNDYADLANNVELRELRYINTRTEFTPTKSSSSSSSTSTSEEHPAKKHVKLIQKAMFMPNCAEQILLALIQFLYLIENDITEIPLPNRTVLLNDEFLKKQLNKLERFLRRENNIVVLNSLKPIFNNITTLDLNDKTQCKQCLTTLEKVYKEQVHTLDIAQMMWLYRDMEELSEEAQGKDILIAVGDTGAGKTTFIHWLAGSSFQNKNGTLALLESHPEVKSFEIGTNIESKTKRISLVDLTKTKTKPKQPKGEKLFAGDTPGFGDTEGKETAIINSMRIAKPLQHAKSLRVSLLCSTSSYGDKAEGFLSVLESVARLLPNIANDCSSLCYAFTGKSEKVTAQRVLKDINDLLASQAKRRYSDGVKVLLEDMRTKFAGDPSKIPFIRPLDKKSITPEKFLELWIALPAIAKPSEAIEPFIEESCQSAVAQQLSFHLSVVNSILERLNNTNGEEDDDEIKNDFHLLDIKIVEMRFIAKILPKSDAISYLSTCLQKLQKLRKDIDEKAKGLFTLSLGQELSPASMKKARQLIRILSAIDGLLTTMGEDVKKNYPPRFSIGSVEEHVVSELAKLKTYHTINENEFLILLYKQIHSYAPKPATSSSEAVSQTTGPGFPTVALEPTDEMQQIRFSAGFTRIRVDNIENLLVGLNRIERSQSELVKSFCEGNKVAVIQSIIANVKTIKTEFAESISDDVTSKIDDFYMQVFVSLSSHFETGLAIDDVITMAAIIDRMHNLATTEQHKQQVDSAKTKFIARLDTLVTTASGICPNYPNPQLTTDNVKQFIYLMQIFLSISEDKNVKEHLLKTSLPSTSEVTIQSLYQKLFDQLSGFYKITGTALGELCNTESDMEGIAKLGELIQQLWFILSIPQKNPTIWQESYQKICEKIKLYVINFSVRFCEQLAVETRVAEAVYSNIANYLMLLEDTNWLGVLQLTDVAHGKLVTAIRGRARKLVAIINSTNVELGSHESLQPGLLVAVENQTLFSKLSKFLDQDTSAALQNAHDSFRNRITIQLNHISDIYSNLERPYILAELATTAAYIDRCEQLAIRREDTPKAKAAIIAYLQHITAARKNTVITKLKSLPTNISEAQEVVASLSPIFSELSELRQSLPAYYAESNDPLQASSEQLKTYLHDFEKQLRACLGLTANSDASISANNKAVLIALVNICKELIPLDQHLPKPLETKAEPLTFKVLHHRFDNLLRADNFPLVSEILSLIYSGQYETAVNKLSTIDPTESLYITLKAQTNVAIAELIKSIKNDLSQLPKSNTLSPVFMPHLVKRIVQLQRAEKLAIANLLTDEIKTLREEVLIDAQAAMDNWLQRCSDEVLQSIYRLYLQSATLAIANLGQTADLEFKPTNVTACFANTSEALSNQLSAVAAYFAQPITAWKEKNTYIISQVVTEYNKAKELSWKNTSYVVLWEQLSSTIFNAVDAECKRIKTGVSTNSLSVTDAVAALVEIGKLMQRTPDDATHLKDSVDQRCKQVVNVIQESMLSGNATINERIVRILGLLEKQQDLTKYLGNLEFRLMTDFVKKHSLQLKMSIIEAFKDGGFPQKEILELSEIYHKLGSHYAFINDDFTACQNGMAEFCNTIFSQLSTNLIKYKGGCADEKTEDVLNSILKNCKLLTTLQQFQTSQKESDDGLFPWNFSNEVTKWFNNLEELFQTNVDKFNTALKDRDILLLEKALIIARDWSLISTETAATIAACDQEMLESPMSELKSLNENYNPRKLAGLVLQVVAEIKKQFEPTVASLIATTERSVKARENYYRTLIRELKFLGEVSKLEQQCFLSNTGATSSTSSNDYQEESCVGGLKKYLQQVFDAACRALPTTVINCETWEQFDILFKELKVFAEECGGDETFNQIELTDSSTTGTTNSFKAVEAATHVQGRFDSLIALEIAKHTTAVNSARATTADYQQELIGFLISLQKIINDVPTLAVSLRKALGVFLQSIKNSRGSPYLQFLATQLRNDETGSGMKLISEQTCFSGLAIALRNLSTQAQGLEYVLDNTTVKEGANLATPLTTHSRGALSAAHAKYEKKYQALLDQYLNPVLADENQRDTHLASLLNDLQALLRQDPVVMRDGNIIWDITVKQKIPEIAAFVFAIWTLRDAKAYFEADGSNDRTHYLKKPHAGQMVTIFRKLKLDDDCEDMGKHLVQLLSGEGKSVEIVGIATILILLGYRIKCPCYSEYLSKRDFEHFTDLINFLGVKAHIHYCTFNSLFEKVINESGDLRDLIEAMITEKAVTQGDAPMSSRPEIIIVDEVDVFFNRDFYGSLYQPSFTLKSNTITSLLNYIWTQHKVLGKVSSNSVKNSSEYKLCIAKYPQWEFLIVAALSQMLADLKLYRHEAGHDYVVDRASDTIVYSYQDGTSAKHSKGYKTLWAYYDEFDHGRISEKARNDQRGLVIHCGAFSYANMLTEMGRFKSILGASGTLQELSEPEKNIILKEFGISTQTFIPSVFGANRLQFPRDAAVRIYGKTDYFINIATEIKRKLVGTSNANVQRAVIVFFKDLKSLLAFNSSEALKELKSPVSLMTENSSSTVAERDAEISKATRSGSITLAVRQFVRGRDFLCLDQRVNANGGVHVLGTFFPTELSEQRQMEYRTARQGQDGSCSMVLLEDDLIQDFGLNAAKIQQIRDSGEIYSQLDKIRIEQFAKTYQALADKMKEVRDKYHIPSMELWEKMRNRKGDRDDKRICELLKIFNPELKTSVKAKKSRTMILMDGTGSMADLINGVKRVLTAVMKGLAKALNENKIASEFFAIQLVIFRHYYDGLKKILQYSKWSSSPENLQGFINKITASGGSKTTGNEAVEIGLFHANREANEPDGLTQVILIGDRSPTTESEFADYNRQYLGGTHSFMGASNYKQEASKLKANKIPVNAFYVADVDDTKRTFTEIATTTGGTAQYLETKGDKGIQALQKVLGESVINDLADGDADLQSNLLQTYAKSFSR